MSSCFHILAICFCWLILQFAPFESHLFDYLIGVGLYNGMGLTWQEDGERLLTTETSADDGTNETDNGEVLFGSKDTSAGEAAADGEGEGHDPAADAVDFKSLAEVESDEEDFEAVEVSKEELDKDLHCERMFL